eukprot:1011616-Rhodomonas_salina.2
MSMRRGLMWIDSSGAKRKRVHRDWPLHPCACHIRQPVHPCAYHIRQPVHPCAYHIRQSAHPVFVPHTSGSTPGVRTTTVSEYTSVGTT